MSDRIISWLRIKDSGTKEGRRYCSKISEGCGLQTWVMGSPSRKGIINHPSNKGEEGKYGGSGGELEGSIMAKSDKRQGAV